MITIEQTPHPILPVLGPEALLRLDATTAAQLITDRERAIHLEKTDPYHHGYEPEMWRRVDRQVARARMELGGNVVLQIVILGGIRSSKTHFAAKTLVQHLIHGLQPWSWALHETEDSSQTIGQRWVHHYLPPQFKTESGKAKGHGTSLSYTPGKGFTGGQFAIGKKVCEFKVYGTKLAALQGAELSLAWGDELVPADVAEVMRERVITRAKDCRLDDLKRKVSTAHLLLEQNKPLPADLRAALYHGCTLLTFTPKEGYSPMVAEILDGAVDVETMPAPLLPLFGPDKQPIGFKTVPLVKRARKRNTLIVFFPTEGNAYGNYEGLCEELIGASEDKIRISAYGDVRKAWSSAFPKFRDIIHVIPLSAVPRKGTFYHRVDPCDTRNFFMSWWLLSGNKHYCVREWPQLGDYIEGVGDPGEWAVSSRSKKYDGDPGSAQEGFGFGLTDYVREIERVELELGMWYHGDEKSKPIPIFERHMDSRFGNAPTPSRDEATTLIEEFEDLGLTFEPAPGEHLKEGVNLINDALTYDEAKPVSSLNAPKFFVVDSCAAMIYSLQNWTGKDGQKGACKDPVDTARYHFLADPQDMSNEPLMVRRARASY